jgi:hypothetical protein
VRVSRAKVMLVVAGGFVVAQTAAAVPVPAQAGLVREQRRDAVYESTLLLIAEAIERLKPEYPQLAEFSAARNFNAEHLHITYFYRVDPPRRTGGWGGMVPWPKDDGLNLYVDFHDPKSEQQLHRQPRVPLFRFRDKAVMLLMVEGKQTKSLRAGIARIFEDHDVRSVPDDWRGDPD